MVSCIYFFSLLTYKKFSSLPQFHVIIKRREEIKSEYDQNVTRLWNRCFLIKKWTEESTERSNYCLSVEIENSLSMWEKNCRPQMLTVKNWKIKEEWRKGLENAYIEVLDSICFPTKKEKMTFWKQPIIYFNFKIPLWSLL